MALDTQIFYMLNSLVGQSRTLDGVIVFFASYLAFILPVILLGLVILSQYPKREKWKMLAVIGMSSVVALGITECIRFFFPRPRPFLALSNVHTLFTDMAASFPSAHSTFFFAMSAAVYLYNKKWGIGFFIAIILITIGRVAAGVHYPSDILGGAVLGVAVAYLAFHAARRFWPEIAD